MREATLSASLNHPNIIRTTDLVTAGDDYFIVMEFLYGAGSRTLLRRIRRCRQRLAPAAALRIAREVLRALAYAHAARDADGRALRLIHRDVSPSNILVSARGEVKLTDFGIAKATTHDSGLFYRVKGKVGYMSPEQATSDPLDLRSDLFSVGVCLYEALTGERLYVSTGITQSASELFAQPIPSVARRVPGLPRELDGLLGRALALRPEDRFPDADLFGEGIDDIIRRHGLTMNAEQLAEHLRTICGPAASWRDELDEDAARAAGRVGTAVLPADDDDLPAPSVMTHQGIVPPRRRRKEESIPALGGCSASSSPRSSRVGASDPLGAEPLVDLDALGTPASVADALASRGHERSARPRRARRLDSVARAPAAWGGADESAVVRSAPPAGRARPAPAAAAVTPATPPARGSLVRTLLLGLALLVVGAGVALAIGLTGPGVELPSKPAG
ncbi:MAG: serine/threonine-protein kinase [Kofleriaceae bacterium]